MKHGTSHLVIILMIKELTQGIRAHDRAIRGDQLRLNPQTVLFIKSCQGRPRGLHLMVFIAILRQPVVEGRQASPPRVRQFPGCNPHAAVAEREGWIALPGAGSLHALVNR